MNKNYKKLRDGCEFQGSIPPGGLATGVALLSGRRLLYEGELRASDLNLTPNGRGYAVYPNKDTFTGTWLHGAPQGNGVYINSSGAVYAGTWARGERSGPGLGISADGDVFIGDWNNDEPAGHGMAHKFDWDATGVCAQIGKWQGKECQDSSVPAQDKAQLSIRSAISALGRAVQESQTAMRLGMRAHDVQAQALVELDEAADDGSKEALDMHNNLAAAVAIESLAETRETFEKDTFHHVADISLHLGVVERRIARALELDRDYDKWRKLCDETAQEIAKLHDQLQRLKDIDKNCTRKLHVPRSSLVEPPGLTSLPSMRLLRTAHAVRTAKRLERQRVGAMNLGDLDI